MCKLLNTTVAALGNVIVSDTVTGPNIIYHFIKNEFDSSLVHTVFTHRHCLSQNIAIIAALLFLKALTRKLVGFPHLVRKFVKLSKLDFCRLSFALFLFKQLLCLLGSRQSEFSAAPFCVKFSGWCDDSKRSYIFLGSTVFALISSINSLYLRTALIAMVDVQ